MLKKITCSFELFLLVMLFASLSQAAETITCWFDPAWISNSSQAKQITDALSKDSGLNIQPRIARSYPQILEAFSSDKPNLVYVGSFVQSIIHSRHLGTQLVQNVNGKEMYSGVFIYPKGQDPEKILKEHPAEISYAKSASSGESSAKAATDGKAAIATGSHSITCEAVKSGRAKGGFVKNWWWEANKQNFPELAVYEVPEISVVKNPDNVLSASKAVTPDECKKITGAAMTNNSVFGANEMKTFDATTLQFSLDLMQRAKIDPLTYNWDNRVE